MSWDGSGTFNRIFSWVADKTASIDISSTRMDTDTDDIASNGFGNCLTRDGQGGPTSNLPMANFKHTGVGNGSARTDSVSLGQVQDGLLNWVAAGGTADALTATYSPAVTAYADGELFFVRAAHANATTTPTLNVNSVGAETITKLGGAALVAGDIPGALAECIFKYNLADTRFELLNPAIPTIPSSAVTNAMLANSAAWTLKGNNTSGSTAPTDFTIDGLTAKSSPTTSDEILLSDAAASNAFKKVTLSALAATIQAALAITAPTVQKFTSGSSQTYTPTSGMVRIKVRMCAGGGGGGAQNTNDGANGSDTSFGGWTAAHGAGGKNGGGTQAGGAGGTGGSNGTGTLVDRVPGGSGGAGLDVGGSTVDSGGGGPGGNNPRSGGGLYGSLNAVANSGGGGAGFGDTSSSEAAGGGGAGEYVEFWMTAAQVGASLSYTVGGGGNGGAAGGNAGGNGAAGVIIVEEFYI